MDTLTFKEIRERIADYAGRKAEFLLERADYSVIRTGEILRTGEGLNFFYFIIASGGHEYCIHYTRVYKIA